MEMFSPPSELILNLAPTGVVPTRSSSASVPLQPKEIVEDVLACAATGITIVHIHARDGEGMPTFRKEVYARIIGGIREKRPDLVICASCSGRNGATLDQRSEVLTLDRDLRPDMASLTLSSMNFASGASINTPDTVAGLAARMQEAGVKPEIEIFDLGMVNVMHYLIDRGMLQPPFYANLMLGGLASAQARFLDIGSLVAAVPAQLTYSLAGMGRTQLAVAGLAAAAAQGVRIGLEDNLWLDQQRTQPASNLELVRRVHALAALQGRRIMTPLEFRNKLGLGKPA